MKYIVPPEWANTLCCTALEYAGNTDKPPSIQWCKTRKPGYYSGTYRFYAKQIKIIVGDIPQWQQEMILLHEIAHHLVGWRKEERSHSKRFWETAWDLYRMAKLPLSKVLTMEGDYRKGAIVAYRKKVT